MIYFRKCHFLTLTCGYFMMLYIVTYASCFCSSNLHLRELLCLKYCYLDLYTSIIISRMTKRAFKGALWMAWRDKTNVKVILTASSFEQGPWNMRLASYFALNYSFILLPTWICDWFVPLILTNTIYKEKEDVK